MAWVAPVYDRTQKDVDDKTAKGYLTYADLNRIEGDMEYLEGRFTDILQELVDYGVQIFVPVAGDFLPTYTNWPRSLTFKTDWQLGDIIDYAESKNIGTNLVVLCNTNSDFENNYQVGGRILSCPSNLNLATVTTINDIEQRLLIRYNATVSLKAYYEALIGSYYDAVYGGGMTTTNTNAVYGGTMTTVNTNTVSGGTF